MNTSHSEMTVSPTLEGLASAVGGHEKRSEERYQSLASQLKESVMSGQEDKVDVKNIFKGMGGGESSGAPWASILPALMANRHDGMGSSGALGAGALGFVAGALINGRRGGIFGGEGEGSGQAVADIATIQGIGDIKAAVAVNAAQTENVVNSTANTTNTNLLQQTLSLNSSLGSLALGIQQGLSGVKDTIQSTSALQLTSLSNVNQNVLLAQANIAAAVNADGEKTRSLITSQNEANLNRMLNSANAEIIELRNDSRLAERTRGIEINMTNNQNQIQAQTQAQTQFQVLANLAAQVQNLANDVQAVRQSSVVFNSGKMDSSGNQGAANTRVA